VLFSSLMLFGVLLLLITHFPVLNFNYYNTDYQLPLFLSLSHIVSGSIAAFSFLFITQLTTR